MIDSSKTRWIIGRQERRQNKKQRTIWMVFWRQAARAAAAAAEDVGGDRRVHLECATGSVVCGLLESRLVATVASCQALDSTEAHAQPE